jgi:hypothetical protein
MEQRRVRLVRRDAGTPDATTDVLRALARVLAPLLREVLAEARSDDDVVEVVTIVPMPRRALFAILRRGEIPGAVRKARRWFARRGDVLAWLRARGRALVTPGKDGDEFEELRRAILRPGRRARR